ncbi:MAG: hypothetical protein R2851_09075 [Caldilineaceae bacterium]
MTWVKARELVAVDPGERAVESVDQIGTDLICCRVRGECVEPDERQHKDGVEDQREPQNKLDAKAEETGSRLIGSVDSIVFTTFTQWLDCAISVR